VVTWNFVTKITNFKHQIPNNSQIQIFNDQNLSGQITFVAGLNIRISVIGICLLFEI